MGLSCKCLGQWFGLNIILCPTNMWANGRDEGEPFSAASPSADRSDVCHRVAHMTHLLCLEQTMATREECCELICFIHTEVNTWGNVQSSVSL